MFLEIRLLEWKNLSENLPECTYINILVVVCIIIIIYYINK